MNLQRLAALSVLVPSAAFAADFSGTWRIDNLFNGASAIIVCTLAQSGNALRNGSPSPITGAKQ